jgi:GntR family transcriptional regulator
MPGRPASEAHARIRTPWKAVAAGCRAAIASGQIGPGEPLPSVADLCAMYFVSRNTVRKALRQLAAEGAAELERGVGYFVPGTPARAPRPLAVSSLSVARQRAVSAARVGAAREAG